MSTQSIRIPVLNSLLYIRDSESTNFPDVDGKGASWLTKSCLAVSCLPDCDGETLVTIGIVHEVRLARAPLFDGILETPSRKIIVETVLAAKILEAAIPRLRTRVVVWTNGHRATDIVVIGLE
jgi:hypothetical protein